MKILTVVVLSLVGCSMNGQESISTMGQDLSTSSGSLSFTLGQVSNETQDFSSSSLQEGVQQVYEDNSTFGIIKNDLEYEFDIYPNPFQDYILIQSQEDQLIGSNYSIYDMSGRIVLRGEINHSRTRINTQFMPSASYIINITSPENRSRSITIEKTR